MTNQNFIKAANRVIKDKVFQYKGPLIFDIPLEVTIEFKLKIVGDLTLISAGEPKNHISLDVTVVNISPEYFSGLIKTIENNQYEIGKNMWFFKTKIEDYLSGVLKVFSIQDDPVLTSIRYK